MTGPCIHLDGKCYDHDECPEFNRYIALEKADVCGRGHLTRDREPPCEVCDLLDLAEEGWAYADEYFQDKWEFKSRLAALKVRLQPRQEGGAA